MRNKFSKLVLISSLGAYLLIPANTKADITNTVSNLSLSESGSTFAAWGGDSATSVYGQAFISEYSDTLAGIKFNLRNTSSMKIGRGNNPVDGDITFKGFVAPFNYSTKRITGDTVFSTVQTFTTSDAIQTITVDMKGAATLESNQTYIIGLSAEGYEGLNAGLKTQEWEYVTEGEAGTGIFYVNSQSDNVETAFSLTQDWDEFQGYSFLYAILYGSGLVDDVSLHTEWVQPYAAMQSVGLGSVKNNRDLVLAKAGECNNSGWVIENTDYCVYTNTNNTIASVNGNSSYGSYDSANFNTSINVEKTINDKWKAGIAYGVGSSNLDNYNFSSTTASLSSTNTHYSIYGVKKVSDKFTLKGMIGGSDFDYKGNRNYSTTSATSTYDTDGYTAEINGIWDIKKTIKNMKTPIRLKPTLGVAFAAHTQDGFSESGSGDLITLEANQAESLLLKTGISVDKQILMEGGKWLLVPSIALNYEMDTYADDNNRGLKGGVTGSTDATTLVSAKTFGQHNGSVKVGADFVLTKDFMFNLNAEYGLAEGGDEQSYGGGFRWQF